VNSSSRLANPLRSLSVGCLVYLASATCMVSCGAKESDEIADEPGEMEPDTCTQLADASRQVLDGPPQQTDASDAHLADATGEPTDAGFTGADVDPGAECEPRALSQCFRGASFADCGGTGASPGVWCRADADECLWFAADCPAVGFTRAIDSCDSVRCLDNFVAWGLEPWTRERAATLQVELNRGEPLTGSRIVECDCADGPPCLGALTFCNPEEIDGYGGASSPQLDDAEWSLPSLVTVRLWAEGGTAGLGSDRTLVLEFDFYRAAGHVARACLVGVSDADARGEPVCASDGRLDVSAIPAEARDVGALHGRFDLTFPDFEPRGINGEPKTRGLRLRGEF